MLVEKPMINMNIYKCISFTNKAYQQEISGET